MSEYQWIDVETRTIWRFFLFDEIHKSNQAQCEGLKQMEKPWEINRFSFSSRFQSVEKSLTFFNVLPFILWDQELNRRKIVGNFIGLKFLRAKTSSISQEEEIWKVFEIPENL